MGKKRERCEVRALMDEIRRWRLTAVLEGVSLSEWIRVHCNASAATQEAVEAIMQRVQRRKAGAL